MRHHLHPETEPRCAVCLAVLDPSRGDSVREEHEPSGSTIGADLCRVCWHKCDNCYASLPALARCWRCGSDGPHTPHHRDGLDARARLDPETERLVVVFPDPNIEHPDPEHCGNCGEWEPGEVCGACSLCRRCGEWSPAGVCGRCEVRALFVPEVDPTTLGALAFARATEQDGTGDGLPF